jgi:hypothetical protein
LIGFRTSALELGDNGDDAVHKAVFAEVDQVLEVVAVAVLDERQILQADATEKIDPSAQFSNMIRKYWYRFDSNRE